MILYLLFTQNQRAGEQEDTDRYKKLEKETGRNYIYLSKKMFVIENIIDSD
jgi:hypothetical protein